MACFLKQLFRGQKNERIVHILENFYSAALVYVSKFYEFYFVKWLTEFRPGEVI